MNELVSSLIACLKQETEHYRRLFVMAEEQKELLIEGKMEVLPDNVRMEEKVVFALGPLISERNDLLAKMAKILGARPISLTEILKKAPLEFIEDLKKAVIELVQSARQLEEVNRGNEKLLNNAISYVDFMLKIIANGGRKKVFSPSVTKEETLSSFVDRVV
ncbi:MAG TPA: flagellar protein FlgN [bacterium]